MTIRYEDGGRQHEIETQLRQPALDTALRKVPDVTYIALPAADGTAQLLTAANLQGGASGTSVVTGQRVIDAYPNAAKIINLSRGKDERLIPPAGATDACVHVVSGVVGWGMGVLPDPSPTLQTGDVLELSGDEMGSVVLTAIGDDAAVYLTYRKVG